MLNKADICPCVDERVRDVELAAVGVPVHPVSAISDKGMEIIRGYLGAGRTAALLGSSGVGKSTIINRLLGYDLLEVSPVREHDSRGRHTTARREMVLIPGGGIMIDTPGLRELQLWGDETGLHRAFAQIDELSSSCRFRDCSHHHEPGCAVQEAMKSGVLEPERFQSFLKLQKELKYLSTRQEIRAMLAEKSKWKKIAKLQRGFKKG